MADEEQLETLPQGVEVWNERQDKHLIVDTWT